MRAAFSCEVGEDALGADGAVRVWCAVVDFAALVGPEVVAEESAAHEVRLVGEEFEGLGGLDGGSQVDGRGEDAGGVAGFHRTSGWLREDACEAGCGKAGNREQGVGSRGLVLDRFWGWLWEDVHCRGVGAYGCSVDPGLYLLDCVVID